MRTVEVEVKNYITKYVADDGTEFSSETECERYEDTVSAVISGRVNKAFGLQINNGSGVYVNGLSNIWNCCDEDGLYCFKPKTKEDIDVLNLFAKSRCHT